MSISEFVQIFLSICGGVSIVGGAAAVIFKWITPAFRLNKRVETLEEHDKRDYESLQRIAERDSLILEVLSTMLDSQISGNNVEELKKTKQKLTNNKLETPKTADNSNIALWLTLLIVLCSSATLYTFAVKTKKINR